MWLRRVFPGGCPLRRALGHLERGGPGLGSLLPILFALVFLVPRARCGIRAAICDSPLSPVFIQRPCVDFAPPWPNVPRCSCVFCAVVPAFFARLIAQPRSCLLLLDLLRRAVLCCRASRRRRVRASALLLLRISAAATHLSAWVSAAPTWRQVAQHLGAAVLPAALFVLLAWALRAQEPARGRPLEWFRFPCRRSRALLRAALVIATTQPLRD